MGYWSIIHGTIYLTIIFRLALLKTLLNNLRIIIKLYIISLNSTARQSVSVLLERIVKRLIPCRRRTILNVYSVSWGLVNLSQTTCTSICHHIYDWNNIDCYTTQQTQSVTKYKTNSKYFNLRHLFMPCIHFCDESMNFLLRSRLATIIRNSLMHTNGNCRYKFLVLGREGLYFVNAHSDFKKRRNTLKKTSSTC